MMNSKIWCWTRLVLAILSSLTITGVEMFFWDADVITPLLLPGQLYPRESESREVKSLDGLWDFAIPPDRNPLLTQHHNWFSDDLSKFAEVMQMPVPSSYNDITTSRALRDHIGPVWYQRSFFVPDSWSTGKRVFLRFGSVNYLAQVWVNNELVKNHEIGHLPFEVEVTSHLKFGARNRISVAVDNTLGQTSVPQGRVSQASTDNGTRWVQSYTFDFFNYAGIHRPVLLHTKPYVFINDITVRTSFTEDMGIVKYTTLVNGLDDDDDKINCTVTILKQDGSVVDGASNNASNNGLVGTIKVPNPELWWPRSMAPNPGYLYTLQVILHVGDSTPDVYRLPFGIRTIQWTNTKLLLNNKKVYLRGFGRHEDSVIRGRGLDLVTMTRDYELLKWVGANAYRTSHYPYSDEVMDMADRQGFLIIDECPSVDTDNFSSELLEKHKHSISELIQRDKNRPSVIAWSIANEPRTKARDAELYFKRIVQHTKVTDPTRPVTASIAQRVYEDRAAQFLDIISFNRYNSWYSNTGNLDMITQNVINEAKAWNKKHNKPVIMSEYGADTMPGLHELPEYVWSEEYQTTLFSKHFKAFDYLRTQEWFIGEFIWNFADFRTAQTYTRVGGNKKGIFTRTREPKMAAHHVRRRYHALNVEIDGAQMQNDVEYYISSNHTQ